MKKSYLQKHYNILFNFVNLWITGRKTGRLFSVAGVFVSGFFGPDSFEGGLAVEGPDVAVRQSDDFGLAVLADEEDAITVFPHNLEATRTNRAVAVHSFLLFRLLDTAYSGLGRCSG
jgi:hypothetical protein